MILTRNAGHHWLITSLLSLAVLGVFSQAAFADNTATRTISVNGEAQMRLAPEMATLRMSVVAENLSAAVARKEADAITSKALTVLDAAGVSRDDVNSTSLSIQPQYRWIKDDRVQELSAYRVSRDIDVRLLDLDKLGELIVALSDTGVNQMQAPRLGLIDRETAYQSVLAQATANARARAEVMASAMDETLAGVQNIGVNGNGSFPVRRYAERAMMAADSAAPGAAQSYSPGHIEFSVTVSATFILAE